MEANAAPAALRYDPSCYMCPGNTRSRGAVNPRYGKVFVFDNDFPALLPGRSEPVSNVKNLLIAKGETGICRVLCFSPRHDQTLSMMDTSDIRAVVDEWAAQSEELGEREDTGYVQIFENRGAMMGASNPHPHCQIWASAGIPNAVKAEQESQSAYLHSEHSCLLCDYSALEHGLRERVVAENACFSAVVPFWAIWPFETMVISRRHVGAIHDLTGEQRDGLSSILKKLTTQYDNLFRAPFPYSMGFHQRPADGSPHPEWHFHAHFYPPLLRSANVRKFMVGYELLAMPQRDITPEYAAGMLCAATRRAPSRASREKHSLSPRR